MSHIGLIQRIQKTPNNKHGIKHIKSIPSDEVCVLYLGGSGTESAQTASGNAKIIEREILPDLAFDIPIYSAYYNFDQDDIWLAKESNFSKYGYNFALSANEKNCVWVNRKNLNHVFKNVLLPRIIGKNGKPLSPDSVKEKLGNLRIVFDGDVNSLCNELNHQVRAGLMELGFCSKDSFRLLKHLHGNFRSADETDFDYINMLFERTILPRISDSDQRLPLGMAMARVRKINIVAHCHGAHVAQKLEEKMNTYMQDLKYSPSEIRQILSQMLVIAHAPVIPLGTSKFCLISFTTAQDYFATRPKNWVTKYVKYREKNHTGTQWMLPCFLGGRNGNVFIIQNAFESSTNKKRNEDEHLSAHYLPIAGQTTLGKFMNVIARNILINGIENSF